MLRHLLRGAGRARDGFGTVYARRREPGPRSTPYFPPPGLKKAIAPQSTRPSLGTTPILLAVWEWLARWDRSSLVSALDEHPQSDIRSRASRESFIPCPRLPRAADELNLEALPHFFEDSRVTDSCHAFPAAATGVRTYSVPADCSRICGQPAWLAPWHICKGVGEPHATGSASAPASAFEMRTVIES